MSSAIWSFSAGEQVDISDCPLDRRCLGEVNDARGPGADSSSSNLGERRHPELVDEGMRPTG